MGSTFVKTKQSPAPRAEDWAWLHQVTPGYTWLHLVTPDYTRLHQGQSLVTPGPVQQHVLFLWRLGDGDKQNCVSLESTIPCDLLNDINKWVLFSVWPLAK